MTTMNDSSEALRQEDACEFLDPTGIASLVGLNPATIRRFLREGAIKGTRFGCRRWRIPRSEVRRMLAGTDAGQRPAGPL
jgi:excisionase family DNA binding protein